MATVLVVEDDKLSQRILGKILRGAGHRPLLAASVDEAWAELNQEVVVDLVILDNQLGQDWGWHFLERMRASLLFEQLPVIVYTGHTERSSILRYVQLGVMSMLVKPYNAESIQEELGKALRTAWAESVIESPARACQRLKLAERDYYSLLSAAAAELDQILQALRTLLNLRQIDPPLREPLQALQSQGDSLGIPVLRRCAEVIGKSAHRRDALDTVNALAAIDSIRALLRRRALAYIGIEEIPTPVEKAKARRSDPAQARASAPAKSSGLNIFRARTVPGPIWELGHHLQRLGGNRFFTEGQFQELAQRWCKEPPFPALFDALNFSIEAAEAATFDQLTAEILKQPRFRDAFMTIAVRAATQPEDEDRTIDLPLAINRLGLYKTTALLTASRLTDALRMLPSPLNLDPLRRQTLGVGLLAYEIGRMLNVADDHCLAAAGFAHNFGSWFFALSEPVLYAVALGLADDRRAGLDSAEREMFGLTHVEAGRILLDFAAIPPVVRESARNYPHPDKVTRPGWQSLIACVHLASELLWLHSVDESTEAIRANAPGPNHPLWGLFQKNNVALPMDVPEFLDALAIATKTTVWIAEVLLGAPAVAAPSPTPTPVTRPG